MGEGQAYPEAVICIPGEWKSRKELVERVAEESGGYLFLGMLLMEVQTRHTFELQLEEADPRMSAAFHAAGPHWRDSEDMARIGGHSSVVYLIGHGGSRTNAESLMAAAEGLLKAGGLGVKIESTGLAHSPAAWLQLVATRDLFSAYRAYVVCVTGEDQVYSCGMHHLGLRDAIVDASVADDALELIRSFTHYLFAESPTIVDGQTFAMSPDAPVYRVHEDEGMRYEESSLFNNPYGSWRLVPID
jgi:Domain of unknown function (DUF4261)